ncbi:hypothetical protein F4V43_09445 [Paenibacillus spiritus]|uniref:Uncharacterized protein n=1 Tax=Paenibacillus spiritus TaxID=2496557 RepID=A0A5J5G9Z4_9BACL|nr:hypothetical protein [Paenibacillus spiritus]KAA9004848.1 hypothetical protein F4V43_09445 [Paenibacillus spiritus]
MTIALLILGYLALLAGGSRRIRGSGSGLRRLLYAGLLGWSLYLAVSAKLGWPRMSLSSLYLIGFEPVGHALFQWLGGES